MIKAKACRTASARKTIMQKTFVDSLFVTLLAGSIQCVEHRCGEDFYRRRFIFAGHDRWRETWTVGGPRKKYLSTTRYWRICSWREPFYPR